MERAARLSPGRVGIVLVYHTVAARPGDPARELVAAHGAVLFEQQLHFLRDRYRLVTASELPDAVATRRRGMPVPIAITFDDDTASHVELAAPALRSLGLPATFFLCGASLDQPFAFWWERLQRAYDAKAPGLATLAGLPETPGPSIHKLGEAFESMSPGDRDQASERLLTLSGPNPSRAGLRREQVASLGRAGFEIGFHTLRHDTMTALSEAALNESLTAGRDALAEAAGQDLTALAYPHGHADARVAAAAGAAGFKSGFTGNPDPVKRRSNRLRLGRIVPSTRSVEQLAAQMSKTLVRALMPLGRPGP